MSSILINQTDQAKASCFLFIIKSIKNEKIIHINIGKYPLDGDMVTLITFLAKDQF